MPVAGEVFLLRKLLPQTADYDFNVHVMDFLPGEFLNVKARLNLLPSECIVRVYQWFISRVHQQVPLLRKLLILDRLVSFQLLMLAG